MNNKTTIGIITIVGLVVIGNIVSVTVIGQEIMSETQKLTALKSELAGYGYDEVRDLTADGAQVEFRANVDENIAEDTLGELVTSFGFELVDFSPAPATEDSMIIVDMNRTTVAEMIEESPTVTEIGLVF